MFTACASAHFAAVLTEYPPSRGNILNQIAKFKGDAYGTDKSVDTFKIPSRRLFSDRSASLSPRAGAL